jgi:hypothetical protein
MKQMFDEEETKFREKIKKREKAEKERREKEKAEREANKSENKVVEKKIEKAKEKEKVADSMKGKMIYQLKKDNPKISQRQICEKLGIPAGSKGRLIKWEKDYLDSLDNVVPGIEPINQEQEDGYSE